MVDKPINRENLDDLLKQVGRVEIELRELSKKQSKFQIELDRIPRYILHINKMKNKVQGQISKKTLYLTKLENDIKKLKK